MVVKVRRNHELYSIKFARGITVEPLKKLGPTDLENGSEVTFKADAEIFTETTTYNYETLRTRIQQLAFLNKGLRITIRDKSSEFIENQKEASYYYEGGIVEFVEQLNQNKTHLNQYKRSQLCLNQHNQNQK